MGYQKCNRCGEEMNIHFGSTARWVNPERLSCACSACFNVFDVDPANFDEQRVGECELGADGTVKLKIGDMGQGVGFKDYKAYRCYPDKPCYIPEHEAEKDEPKYYTYRDFLHIAEGNWEIADHLFDFCDWQYPETALEDDLRDGEIARCTDCGRLVHVRMEPLTRCPYCGWRAEAPEDEVPDNEVLYQLTWTAEDVKLKLEELGLSGNINEMIDAARKAFGQNELLHSYEEGWSIIEQAIKDVAGKEVAA